MRLEIDDILGSGSFNSMSPMTIFLLGLVSTLSLLLTDELEELELALSDDF